ncbi:hypothetical protein HYQ44_005806 [Verticillium longisporum]|nr:hypothetical protein HYQ44_005806 [Verticillium longisporum]
MSAPTEMSALVLLGKGPRQEADCILFRASKVWGLFCLDTATQPLDNINTTTTYNNRNNNTMSQRRTISSRQGLRLLGVDNWSDEDWNALTDEGFQMMCRVFAAIRTGVDPGPGATPAAATTGGVTVSAARAPPSVRAAVANAASPPPPPPLLPTPVPTSLPLIWWRQAHRVWKNLFLDWGITYGTLLNVKEKTVNQYNGGKLAVSVTRLETVGKAVVGVLKNPEATANRSVRIEDAKVSYSQIAQWAQEAIPGSWSTPEVDSNELKAKADEALGKGVFDGWVWFNYILQGATNESYGPHFQNVDNEVLGLKGLSGQELEDYVKTAIKQNA